jgi:hypothetical protein
MTGSVLDGFFDRGLDVLILTAPETPRAEAFAETLAEFGLTVRLASPEIEPRPAAACLVRLDQRGEPGSLFFDLASWTGAARTAEMAGLLREIGPLVGRPGLADWAAIRLEEDPEALRRWADANPQDPAVEEAWGRLEALETDALHAHLERARAAFTGPPADPGPELAPALRGAEGAVRPEPGLWPRSDAARPDQSPGRTAGRLAGLRAGGPLRGASTRTLMLLALLLAGVCALLLWTGAA